MARIADGAELLNIAVKTEHKDAGVAALERALEAGAGGDDVREVLDGVANRAKSKGVGKTRARDHSDDGRGRGGAAGSPRAVAAPGRGCRRARGGDCGSSGDRGSGTHSSTRRKKNGARSRLMARSSSTPIPRRASAALVEQARNEIARLAREEEERRAAEEQRAALLRSHEELCERVERAQAEEALDQVDRARGEWEGLRSNPNAPLVPELQRRFDAACAAAAERHQRREQIAAMSARLGRAVQCRRATGR